MADIKKCKVPSLRFKGFTNDWEQQKLGDMVRVTMGQSPTSSNYTNNPDDHVLVQGNADLKSNKIYPRVWTKEVTKTVHSGEIIITVRAPVGHLAIANMNAVIGRGVAAINGNKFLYYLLQTKLMNNTWEKFSTGSTFESISSNDIKDLEINTSVYEEEQSISKLMDIVTNLIYLQQRKLDLLKQLKKGLLQKMFADKYNMQPILRFEGFHDDWVQRELGEVGKIVGGGTPNTKISSYWNGPIDWYTPAEISGFVYTNHSKRTITLEGLQHSSAQLLPKGTVLFTSRAGIGKTAILSKKGSTNQGFQSIIPNKDLLDSYFVFSLTSKLKKYGETHGAGSTFVEVSGKELSKAPIVMPKLLEQQNISTLNKKLDSLITLQQQKLAKYKSIKKSLLQQMFI